jgi:hypothetical protein
MCNWKRSLSHVNDFMTCYSRVQKFLSFTSTSRDMNDQFLLAYTCYFKNNVIFGIFLGNKF